MSKLKTGEGEPHLQGDSPCAQSGKHASLDFGVVSGSPMLGLEIA